jgi:hypothetical protein
MPEKMARSAPQPPFRAARGDGSCPNLASVLQEGRKIASIHASSGAIWRIPVGIAFDTLLARQRLAFAGFGHFRYWCLLLRRGFAFGV